MTKEEVHYFRERKRLKTNWAKDGLLYALCILWILSIKFTLDFAFNLLDDSRIFLFTLSMLGILSVSLYLVMSIKLRGSISSVEKNDNFNFKQLVNLLKNENWVIQQEEADFICAETDDALPVNSIAILIDEKTIYFNSRPRSIRPLTYLSDWKIRKKLAEIIKNA